MKNKSIFFMVSLSILLICISVCIFLIRQDQTILQTYSPFFQTKTSATTHNPAVSNGRININIASAEELSYLPGIGPALAIRIVQYRIENGIYTSTEELMKVEGINQSKYDALLPYITIG